MYVKGEKMFKKSILFAAIVTTSLYAVSYGKPKADELKAPKLLKGMPLAESYFGQLPKDLTKDELVDLIDMLKDDEDFKKGNQYLYNGKYKIKKKNVYDAEFPLSPRTIEMANYPEALKYFEKSAKSGNPVAAYEGALIIKNYLGESYKNAKKDMKLFMDVLYENKTCEGYLLKGRSLLYGRYGEKVDLKKAKMVFLEGLKKCKDISFYGNVFSGKLLTIDVKERRKGNK